MGRKFFQKYGRKYFRHRTGNSSYCQVGEISSLLGKIDIFHNLSGKRSKKSEQFSVLWNNFRFSWEKFPTTQEICEMFSPFLIYFLTNQEISPKIRSIFLKFMTYFRFLQENLCFLWIQEKFPNTQQENLPIFFTMYIFSKVC